LDKHDELRQVFECVPLRRGRRVAQGGERAVDGLPRFIHGLLDGSALTDIIYQALDAFGILPAAFGQGQDVFII
jgi:hypothetical protein